MMNYGVNEVVRDMKSNIVWAGREIFEGNSVGRLFGHRGKPRILITICWTFPIYSHSFVYQEISQLIEAGFDVRIMYSASGDPAALGDSFAGLRERAHLMQCDRTASQRDLAYFQARMPQRVASVAAEIAAANGVSVDEVLSADHFLFGCTFARHAKAWGADYIHSYFFYESSLFAAVAGGLLNLPRGVSCYADHLLQDYPLKMVGTHLAQTSVVVATSARIKAELSSINPAAADHILVKPNAVDVRHWPRAAADAPRHTPPVLVAVSRIDGKKGLKYLLQAMAILRDRGVVVRMRILGAPDRNADAEACAAELAELMVSLDLAGIVEMPGAVTRAEVRAALQGADIFTAPAIELENGDKDGIPTALLEAMACAVPVVVTDAGSISEVVTDGHNGLSVAQRDPQAFADAIEKLVADEALARRLGAQGRLTVEQRFDVAVCEGAFHDAIRRSLRGVHAQKAVGA